MSVLPKGVASDSVVARSDRQGNHTRPCWVRMGQSVTNRPQGQRALERMVLSLCLSLSCAVISASLIIVARLPFEFAGPVVVALAVGLIGLCFLTKPKLTISAEKLRGAPRYWLPVALSLFHLTLWAIYLVDYPYFPNTEPPDALWHAGITLSILQGAFTTPFSQSGFAGGAHILFAFASSYFDVGVIFAERVTAAIVESLSVLVAYCLFHRILPSKQAANYASVAFAIIVPAGFVYYASVGAYPNIVGDFFVLTSLLVAVAISARITIGSLVTAVVVETITLISHVSALIFLLVVVCFSLAVFNNYRSKFRGYMLSNLGFFFVPLGAVLAAPFLVMREFSYVTGFYLDLHNDLAVVLGAWVHNYLFLAGSINCMFLMAAFVWAMMKMRSSIWPMFLTSWFGLLIILVFIGTEDWRMVLLSFVPGAGLLGILLSKVQKVLERAIARKIRALRTRRVTIVALMLVLIVILSAGGPSAYALSHAFSNGQSTRQRNIYDSMVWLQSNTPPNTTVASVGFPLEYRYLLIVTTRGYAGDFQLNAAEILKHQSPVQFSYVAVSSGFIGLNTFYASNSYRVEYQNADVVIFRIVA